MGGVEHTKTLRKTAARSTVCSFPSIVAVVVREIRSKGVTAMMLGFPCGLMKSNILRGCRSRAHGSAVETRPHSGRHTP